MKKRHFILLGILVLVLFFWYREQPEQRVPRILSQKLDSSLRNSQLLYYSDTHGGFHGDGATIAVVRLRQSHEEHFLSSISRNPNWHPLPMSRQLFQALQSSFPGESDGLFDPPTPEQGWYYFYDRHSQSNDPADTSQLFSRGSYNYDLAVYDAAEKTVWFFALDT